MSLLEQEKRRLYRLFELVEVQIEVFEKTTTDCFTTLQSIRTLSQQLNDMKWDGETKLSETIMQWLPKPDQELPLKLIEKLLRTIDIQLEVCREHISSLCRSSLCLKKYQGESLKIREKIDLKMAHEEARRKSVTEPSIVEMIDWLGDIIEDYHREYLEKAQAIMKLYEITNVNQIDQTLLSMVDNHAINSERHAFIFDIIKTPRRVQKEYKDVKLM